MLSIFFCVCFFFPFFSRSSSPDPEHRLFLSNFNAAQHSDYRICLNKVDDYQIVFPFPIYQLTDLNGVQMITKPEGKFLPVSRFREGNHLSITINADLSDGDEFCFVVKNVINPSIVDYKPRITLQTPNGEVVYQSKEKIATLILQKLIIPNQVMYIGSQIEIEVDTWFFQTGITFYSENFNIFPNPLFCRSGQRKVVLYPKQSTKSGSYFVNFEMESNYKFSQDINQIHSGFSVSLMDPPAKRIPIKFNASETYQVISASSFVFRFKVYLDVVPNFDFNLTMVTCQPPQKDYVDILGPIQFLRGRSEGWLQFKVNEGAVSGHIQPFCTNQPFLNYHSKEISELYGLNMSLINMKFDVVDAGTLPTNHSFSVEVIENVESLKFTVSLSKNIWFAFGFAKNKREAEKKLESVREAEYLSAGQYTLVQEGLLPGTEYYFCDKIVDALEEVLNETCFKAKTKGTFLF